MCKCYFCGTDRVYVSKVKIIGKDGDKKKRKTLRMCDCCCAMTDSEWIAEQLGWTEVISVE